MFPLPPGLAAGGSESSEQEMDGEVAELGAQEAAEEGVDLRTNQR